LNFNVSAVKGSGRMQTAESPNKEQRFTSQNTTSIMDVYFI